MTKIKVDYEFLKGEDGLNMVSSKVDVNVPLMFDIETIGLYGKIRLAQFYQKGWDKPLLVDYPPVGMLRSILENSVVVSHNISYEISTIQRNGTLRKWCPDRIDDTFYLSRLFFYKEQKFTLDNCVKYTYGYNPYEELGDKKELQKQKWNNEELTEKQKLYASYDVYFMQGVYDKVKTVQEDFSYKLDIVTLKNFLCMQRNGMPVDKQILDDRYAKNEQIIKEEALPVNCNSYKQVRDYIGSEKSDDKGLAELEAKGNEKAGKIRKIRRITKENSFLNKFRTKENKIYGVFSPSARSGRSTCSSQNLQQIPRTTKNCFGVKKNGSEVMVYSDFSQLELRCVCAVTGDSRMENLFRSGEDLHNYTACKLFDTKKPTKKQRQIAKTCNFGLLFGAGSRTFADILLKNTGIVLSTLEADYICRKWRNLWSSIKEWQQKGARDWKNNKVWQTPLGRKYVADKMTDQLNIQIQGFGSEVAKLSNHYINLKLEASGIENWRNMQVNFIHDSYIFVVPNKKEIYIKISEIIADSMQEAWAEMSSACKIKDIPMPVEVIVGYNWEEIESDNEEVKVYEHRTR